MKKLFALALLLGLGIMVGCEEKPKTPGSTKPTVTKPSGEAAPAPAKSTGEAKPK